MSVVVWDGKTLAADQQSSSEFLATKATKVRRTKTAILAWVGTHAEGIALADWFEAGADPEKWPDFQQSECFTTLIVIKKKKAFSYEHIPTPIPVEDPYTAWGSGRNFALGAMAMGADAAEAVRVAMDLSHTCGFGITVEKA